jgi:hypothetical protein
MTKNYFQTVFNGGTPFHEIKGSLLTSGKRLANVKSDKETQTGITQPTYFVQFPQFLQKVHV